MPAGPIRIDDWTSDGNRATGVATFLALDAWGAPVEVAQPVTGTFELGCAGN